METPRAKEGERRVAIDSWDVDGWNLLAMEAQRAPFPVAKPVYERLVTQFPPTGKFWRFYAEQLAQQQTKDLEPVFELYDRAVADAPTSVDLWQSYVSLMVAHFVQSSSPSLETRTIAVFERALAAAGLDIKSDTLWSQYLVFIADHASLSDAQRREDLRRLHQRAVMHCTSFCLPCPFCTICPSFTAADCSIMHTARRIACLSRLMKKRTCTCCLLASRISTYYLSPVHIAALSCALILLHSSLFNS